MPCSDDEEHSPSEFYYPGETNYPNATCQGEADNAEQNNNKNSYEKVFSTKWSFLQNQNNKAI